MSNKCSKSEMAYCLGFIVNHFMGWGAGGDEEREDEGSMGKY